MLSMDVSIAELMTDGVVMLRTSDFGHFRAVANAMYVVYGSSGAAWYLARRDSTYSDESYCVHVRFQDGALYSRRPNGGWDSGPPNAIAYSIPHGN